MNEEQLKIYLENKDQIEDAISLKNKYKEHVHKQVLAIESHKINDKELFYLETKYPKSRSNEAGNVTFFRPKSDNNLRLNLSYRKLWRKEGIFIIRVELSNKNENLYQEL